MRSLQEIKQLRIKYGLSQKELANKASVSQSLIAKIEAGLVEPTFGKAKRIFEALEQMREKIQIKAKEVMSKKVVRVDVNDTVKSVIAKMKKREISQVPVLAQGRVCGIITEGTILRKIVAAAKKVTGLRAGDIMDEAPPIVPAKTGLKTLTELLQDYPIVLVAIKGEVRGVVSKADLLGKVE